MSTSVTKSSSIFDCAKCGIESPFFQEIKVSVPAFPHLCSKCKDNFDRFLMRLFLKSDIEQIGEMNG